MDAFNMLSFGMTFIKILLKYYVLSSIHTTNVLQKQSSMGIKVKSAGM